MYLKDILPFISQICLYGVFMNVGLMIFNLIPIPPLDGSKIIGELSGKAQGFYWRYQRYWRIVLIVCVLTGILSKPLGMLNSALLNTMWKLIKLMLGFGL